MTEKLHKFSPLLIFYCLVVFAFINTNLMQIMSFFVITAYLVLFLITKKHIQNYIFIIFVVGLFLLQYVFGSSIYNINFLNVSILFIYLLIYLAIFKELDLTHKLSKKHQPPEIEKLVFLSFIFLFFISIVLGENQISTRRFAGTFENVLNFTGMIAIFYSFYILFYGVNKKSTIITILVGILAFLSLSKILAVLVLFFVFKVIITVRLLIFPIILGCIYGAAVNYPLILEIFSVISDSLSIKEGPITHRLERYARIFDFNLIGIPHAHATMCSKTMSEACFTSESFMFGFILTFGLSGVLVLLLWFRKLINFEFLPITICFLLTGSFFTPSTILTLWTLIKLQKNFIKPASAKTNTFYNSRAYTLARKL